MKMLKVFCDGKFKGYGVSVRGENIQFVQYKISMSMKGPHGNLCVCVCVCVCVCINLEN